MTEVGVDYVVEDVGVPVVFSHRGSDLRSEHGMPYSRRIAERLAGCIPHSRFVEIASATHFMSYQDPNAFNAVVLAFLDETCHESVTFDPQPSHPATS